MLKEENQRYIDHLDRSSAHVHRLGSARDEAEELSRLGISHRTVVLLAIARRRQRPVPHFRTQIRTIATS